MVTAPNNAPKRRKRLTNRGNALADKFEIYIQNTIIYEMIMAAAAANLPQQFINNIRIKRVSKTRYEIINDWKSEDGKPLAVYFEHGTRDHWISGKPLAWFQKEASKNPRAIYSQSSRPYPAMIYSMGHYVTGLPATEAMHNGFRIGNRRLKTVLAEAAQQPSGRRPRVTAGGRS